MLKIIIGLFITISFSSHAVLPQDTLSLDLLLKVESKYGKSARKRVEELKQLINDNQEKSEMEKLEIVNDFFNKSEFSSDVTIWNKNNDWASPIEFLGRNAGGSEDFTIAKYFTLRALNVPKSKLFIMYVTEVGLDQSHVVVTYYKKSSSMPMVLDNFNRNILAGSSRSDLHPLHAFKGENLWSNQNKIKGIFNESHNNVWVGFSKNF
jgi:predicted transglutaminase-like cysteine proteinase